MNNCPLVTVIVITYNSSEYVIETLESIFYQSYHNIEIIITDDCSQDNTVDVCRKWIDKHNNLGKKIKIVEAPQNTGVSGNCNRGLRASKGEWIKVIAGDDMLAPDAIEAFVNYVVSHPGVKHLRGGAVHFTGKLTDDDLRNPDKISQFYYREEMTARDQYKIISKVFFGSGPAYFIKADALKEVGGYDERFYMQEDYPLFIKMIGKGYKMMFLDHVVVYKRIVPTSLQYDKTKGDIFSKNRVRAIMEWKYEYKREALSKLWRILLIYSLWIQRCIIKAGNSYNNYKCRILYLIFTCTDPFVWYGRYISYKCKQYI